MTAPASEFTGSRLKVQRAYRHIQELETIFRGFLQTEFCRLVVESDPQTGNQLIKVASLGSPPSEVSLVIGDIVHNLRCALDHAMVAILGKRRNQVAFPIAKNRDNPGSHSTYGIIKEALPELAILLVDQIGIHDTGDLCLWAISALDNLDKHNLLIAAVSVQELRGIGLHDKARNNRFTDLTVRLQEGGIASLIQYGGGGLEITSKGQPAATILFGKGQPLEGRPIIQSLLKLAELTSQTIQTLEFFWFGQKPEGAATPSATQ